MTYNAKARRTCAKRICESVKRDGFFLDKSMHLFASLTLRFVSFRKRDYHPDVMDNCMLSSPPFSFLACLYVCFFLVANVFAK